MSRGLGKMQRMLLEQIAQYEVWRAEEATKRQEPYLPPRVWSLRQMLYRLSQTTLADHFDRRDRWEHESNVAFLKDLKAGDEGAIARFNFILRICKEQNKNPPEWLQTLDTSEYDPERHARPLDRVAFERFNPTRTVQTLIQRGLVHRWDCPFSSRPADSLPCLRALKMVERCFPAPAAASVSVISAMCPPVHPPPASATAKSGTQTVLLVNRLQKHAAWPEKVPPGPLRTRLHVFSCQPATTPLRSAAPKAAPMGHTSGLL
jgi:hypothetical protein